MPVVVATFVPNPDDFEKAIEALSSIVPKVHLEEGCELYSLHRSRNKLVMIEKWTDRETLDAHSNSPTLIEFTEVVAPLLVEPVKVMVLESVPFGDEDKGTL